MINHRLADIKIISRINNDEIRTTRFQIVQTMVFTGSEEVIDRQFVGFFRIDGGAADLPGAVHLLGIGGLQESARAGICHALVQHFDEQIAFDRSQLHFAAER